MSTGIYIYIGNHSNQYELRLRVESQSGITWDGKHERVKLDIKQSRGIELQKPTDSKAKAVS